MDGTLHSGVTFCFWGPNRNQVGQMDRLLEDNRCITKFLWTCLLNDLG